MSVTLTTQPSIPALSLNPCVYVVSTSETGNGWYIRCYLWIEDTPESDTWTNVADLIQPVIDGSASINLQPYLNELLEYSTPEPDAGQVQIMQKVSRRYKVEFFEYKTDDLELIEEVYHEDGSTGYKDISLLENGQAYLIVLDQAYDDLKIHDGYNTLDCDAPSNYLVNSGSTNYTKIGNLYHHAVTTTTTLFNQIQLSTHTKAQIYKAVFHSRIQDIRDPFALKAGMSKELLYKPLAAPAAPTNLEAVLNSSDKPYLTWTDNSNGTAGFEIARSTDGNNYTIVANVSANVLYYTDSSAYKGIVHYKVRSKNGSKTSAYTTPIEILVLTFNDYGVPYLELRGYDIGTLVEDVTSPLTNIYYKTWQDQSGNGLNFTQLDHTKQWEYRNTDLMQTTYNFNNSLIALPDISTNRIHLVHGNKADFNFLHQGTTDWSIYHEFIARDDRVDDNNQNGPAMIYTGSTYQRNGIQIQHLHHPDLVTYPNRRNVMRVWMFNGNTELVELLTTNDTVVKGLNYLLIRFTASSRLLEVKINEAPTVSATVTNNFSTADSADNFTIINNGIYGIGSVVIWKTLINDTEFNDIKTLMSNYYGQST